MLAIYPVENSPYEGAQTSGLYVSMAGKERGLYEKGAIVFFQSFHHIFC